MKQAKAIGGVIVAIGLVYGWGFYYAANTAKETRQKVVAAEERCGAASDCVATADQSVSDVQQPASIASQPQGILFTSDFESGHLSAWHKELSSAHSGRVVDDPLGSGNKVARFEYRFGDPKAGGGRHAEIKQAPVSTTGEYWYGFSTLVPTDWVTDNSWTILAQWHGSPDKAQGEPWRSPPLALEVKGNQVRINTRSDARQLSPKKIPSNYVWRGNLSDLQGKWTHWVFRVNWSYQNDGFLQVWKDGNRVVDYTGPIGYNDTRGTYFKAGIYQGNSPHKPTRVTYFDNFLFGDSRTTFSSIAQRLQKNR